MSEQDFQGKISGFLKRVKRNVDDVRPDTALFADGVGLDSLETAEFAAILEDELGSDPFSEGEMPQTVGEVVEYYEKSSDA